MTASFHDMVRSLADEATKTNPTAFHHMLARLAQENRLTRLYTQNIDGLEASMPPLETQVPLNNKAPWPRTIQLHGSLSKMICQKCRHMLDFQGHMFDGPEAPLCPACWETDVCRTTVGQRSHGVGKMRPRIVLYNEHNPDGDAIASVMNADVRSRPDALIVVGTSMKIPGVRSLVRNLCKVIRCRRNGKTIWINNDPPSGKEFDDCWDIVVKGDCEKVAQLADLKRWNDNTDSMLQESLAEDAERAKKDQKQMSVIIETPKKKQKMATGLPTPSSSKDENEPVSSQESPKRATRSNSASKVPSINDVLLRESKTKGEAKKAQSKKPTPRSPPKSPSKSPSKAVPKPAAKSTSKSTSKATSKSTSKSTSRSTSRSTVRSKTSRKDEGKRDAKITNFSKVTKGSKVTSGADKAAKLEKDPMLPLPPVAARNNGPTSPKSVSKRNNQ